MPPTAPPWLYPLSDDLEANLDAIANMMRRPSTYDGAQAVALAVLAKFDDMLVPTYRMQLCVAIASYQSPMPHEDREIKQLVNEQWTRATTGLTMESFDKVVEHGCRLVMIYLEHNDYRCAYNTILDIEQYAKSATAIRLLDETDAAYRRKKEAQERTRVPLM